MNAHSAFVVVDTSHGRRHKFNGTSVSSINVTPLSHRCYLDFWMEIYELSEKHNIMKLNAFIILIRNLLISNGVIAALKTLAINTQFSAETFSSLSPLYVQN
jgi:hypothetical protein